MTRGEVIVAELLTGGVERVPPSAMLEEAARRMAGADVELLVVEEEGVAVGVVTDRDIVVRAIARGLAPSRTEVRRAMTPRVLGCSPREDVLVVAERMCQLGVRRLVVVDEADGPIGVLSFDDIAALLDEGSAHGLDGDEQRSLEESLP